MLHCLNSIGCWMRRLQSLTKWNTCTKLNEIYNYSMAYKRDSSGCKLSECNMSATDSSSQLTDLEYSQKQCLSLWRWCVMLVNCGMDRVWATHPHCHPAPASHTGGQSHTFVAVRLWDGLVPDDRSRRTCNRDVLQSRRPRWSRGCATGSWYLYTRIAMHPAQH